MGLQGHQTTYKEWFRGLCWPWGGPGELPCSWDHPSRALWGISSPTFELADVRPIRLAVPKRAKPDPTPKPTQKGSKLAVSGQLGSPHHPPGALQLTAPARPVGAHSDQPQLPGIAACASLT